MARIVQMTEYRMKDLIYWSHVYDVSITFSGLDCSVVTITNKHGTYFELDSSLCFRNWFDYRLKVLQVMSALSCVAEELEDGTHNHRKTH